MSEQANDLLTELRGNALWLTINREERRNAMSPAVLTGIRAGIERNMREPGPYAAENLKPKIV